MAWVTTLRPEERHETSTDIDYTFSINARVWPAMKRSMAA
jgi:hypothetical protein